MAKFPLRIPDAWLLECDSFCDQRGSFQTLWESAGIYGGALEFSPQSAHHACCDRSGTLRGLHYQREPHSQAKLVSCVAGRTWEVILDLRSTSPAYLQWEGVELDASTPRALFIPRGCAHGYVTRLERTALVYLIEGRYMPDAAAVVRWNDPRFGISWPVSDPIVSEKDRLAPDFRP